MAGILFEPASCTLPEHTARTTRLDPPTSSGDKPRPSARLASPTVPSGISDRPASHSTGRTGCDSGKIPRLPPLKYGGTAYPPGVIPCRDARRHSIPRRRCGTNPQLPPDPGAARRPTTACTSQDTDMPPTVGSSQKASK